MYLRLRVLLGVMLVVLTVATAHIPRVFGLPTAYPVEFCPDCQQFGSDDGPVFFNTYQYDDDVLVAFWEDSRKAGDKQPDKLASRKPRGYLTSTSFESGKSTAKEYIWGVVIPPQTTFEEVARCMPKWIAAFRALTLRNEEGESVREKQSWQIQLIFVSLTRSEIKEVVSVLKKYRDKSMSHGEPARAQLHKNLVPQLRKRAKKSFFYPACSGSC